MQKEDQLLLSQHRQSLFNHNSQILNLNDYRPLLCHQQDLLLYQKRAAGDTVAAGTKQSAGAGSLASAGEVPKRAKKQHPSQPPSRTGSSDATLVDPVSIAAESEAADVVLPPVPESISSGQGRQATEELTSLVNLMEQANLWWEKNKFFKCMPRHTVNFVAPSTRWWKRELQDVADV